MLQFCFLAFLLVQANAQYQCEDVIKTEVLEDYEQLVGNWTFLVNWDNIDDDDDEDGEDDASLEEEINCTAVEISEASQNEVQSMQESCKNDSYYDFFDYANAKYKLVTPASGLEKSFIAVGSEKSIMNTCGYIASLQVRRVSDDYVVMINYEFGYVIGRLLGKKIPDDDELACLMYNIDVMEGLNPDLYCYSEDMRK